MTNTSPSARRDTGRRRRPFLVVVLAWCLVCGAAPKAGTAAEPPVPRQIQIALTLRILEYDRALQSWAGTELVVGVVARGDTAELRDGLAGHSAQGVTLSVVGHSYRSAEALGGWMDQEGVQLLLLSPDLDAGTEPACAVAQGRKVPVLALTRAQFETGGTLGIAAKAGKPHVLVNLPASKMAGMNLDPKLLQLAEVVR